jgi:hypothetical protein
MFARSFEQRVNCTCTPIKKETCSRVIEGHDNDNRVVQPDIDGTEGAAAGASIDNIEVHE